MGAFAGAISDKVSLGFVTATEEQVCQHLKNHQRQLPFNDRKSHSIIKQMLKDESKHAHAARVSGGVEFAKGIKQGMRLLSKVMTKTAYFI